MSGDILLPANVPQSEVNSAFGEDYFQLWFGRMNLCVCVESINSKFTTLSVYIITEERIACFWTTWRYIAQTYKRYQKSSGSSRSWKMLRRTSFSRKTSGRTSEDICVSHAQPLLEKELRKIVRTSLHVWKPLETGLRHGNRGLNCGRDLDPDLGASRQRRAALTVIWLDGWQRGHQSSHGHRDISVRKQECRSCLL